MLKILTSKWLRGILAVAGFGFIAVSLVESGVPMGTLLDLGIGRLVAIATLCVVSLLSASAAWSVLVERPYSTSGLAFLRALPAKHIPGGLGLPIAQLSYGTSQGDEPGQVVVRIAQHFFISSGVGGLVVVTLAGVSGAFYTSTGLIGLPLAGTIVLSFPTLIGRVSKRLRGRLLGEPAPAIAIAQASLLTAVGLIALGFAYVILLSTSEATIVATIRAFVLSWTVGFVAIPVPGGIGVRESVLLVSLDSVDPGKILLASVVLRVLMLGCEVFLAVASRLFGPRSERAPVVKPSI